MGDKPTCYKEKFNGESSRSEVQEMLLETTQENEVLTGNSKERHDSRLCEANNGKNNVSNDK